MRNEEQPGRVLMTRWFTRRIHFLLQRGDWTALEEELQCNWPVPLLLNFLAHGRSEVREMAAISLMLTGDSTAIPSLVERLGDPEAKVAQAADHALWAIWCRHSSGAGQGYLKCGAYHLKHGNFCAAIEKFTLAIAADPEFPEAYNQRSIAYYLAERYVDSIHDCLQVLERLPVHFGAMAGMGHCYVHLGDLTAARDCYRHALRIHPRLDDVAAALAQIDQILQRRRGCDTSSPAPQAA